MHPSAHHIVHDTRRAEFESVARQFAHLAAVRREAGAPESRQLRAESAPRRAIAAVLAACRRRRMVVAATPVE